MPLPTSLRNDLQVNGFAILPDVFPRTAIDTLIAAVIHADVHERTRNDARYAIRDLLAIAAFRTLAESDPLRLIVNRLLSTHAFPIRGLLFDKNPSANWKVPWHQDITIEVKQRAQVPGYGPWSTKAGIECVQPPADVLDQMLTLRIHLDDCDESNGPLKVLPGSHRFGILPRDRIEQLKQSITAVACVVPSGGVLIMKPLLLHASSPAKSPTHRRIVHLDYSTTPLPPPLQWAAMPPPRRDLPRPC